MNRQCLFHPIEIIMISYGTATNIAILKFPLYFSLISTFSNNRKSYCTSSQSVQRI